MRICRYRHCGIKFIPRDGRQHYCCSDHQKIENRMRWNDKSRDYNNKRKKHGVPRSLGAHNPKRTKRRDGKKCHASGCNNPVGAGLYWLCDRCYKQGFNEVEEEYHMELPS